MRPGFRTKSIQRALCGLALSLSVSAQTVVAPQPPQQPALKPAPPQEQQPLPALPDVRQNSPAQNAPPPPVDLRDIPSINPLQPPMQNEGPALVEAGRSKIAPAKENFGTLRPSFFGYLGPYRRANVPPMAVTGSGRLATLVRDGKLYLSLHDALALAIENNLDVEIERYNLLLADTDITRAKGGGSTRGISTTLFESPLGVGGPQGPLLDAAALAISPINPSVLDLSSLGITSGAQTNLAQGVATPYSSGPAVPLFDPSIIGDAGWLLRKNTVSLTSTGTGTDGSGSGATTTTPGSLNYTVVNLSYLQGFSTGAQLEGVINNDSQVIYGSQGEADPFHAPSTSLTLTQPLLRGFGRGVNLRYLKIANLDRSQSRLLFEQQLINTVYGVSRLYYDLVSLGENVGVKQETLRAAQKLVEDDQAQVDEGTLAPIELVRAKALVSSSRLDLVQAEGQYRQQEVILRSQLIRSSADLSPQFASIVPTEKIYIPSQLETLSIPDLTREALDNRRDLAQSELQVKEGQISVGAARNQALPQLNVYGNVQTRGSSETPFQTLGSTGTALPNVPLTLALGGLRTSTIYQAGIQVTLPLRNRVAQADAARDAVQLRQAEAGTLRLENQVRSDVETSAVALESAQTAYQAAQESRQFQETLLAAERDKLSVGASTNFLIVQDEAYLAQARSTEVASRGNWIKARIALDRSLGNLLQKNGIVTEDAVSGVLR